MGQLGEPLHLLVERLPVAGVGRQAAQGVDGAEQARDDRDIACGARSNLIEGLGQQGIKAVSGQGLPSTKR